MRVHPHSKLGWVVLVGAILVFVFSSLAAWYYTAPAVNINTTKTTTDNRQRYAMLYEAGWRQDDGRDVVLVTATLLVPPTIAALGTDTARSGTEEQIWNFVRTLDAKTIPLVLTIDSVTGFVSDNDIQKSLELLADGGQKFTLTSWQPIISPSRVVNTNGSVSSQSGVVLFSTDQNIIWPTLGTLKLKVNNLGDQDQRVMTWAEPQLLLEL